MICHWWSFPQETAVLGGSFRAVLSGFHTPIGETGVLHALESETTKSHRVTNCIPFCSSVLSTRKTGPQGQRPNSNRTGGEAGKLRADLVAAQALTDIAQRRTPFANDSLVPVSAHVHTFVSRCSVKFGILKFGKYLVYRPLRYAFLPLDAPASSRSCATTYNVFKRGAGTVVVGFLFRFEFQLPYTLHERRTPHTHTRTH